MKNRASIVRRWQVRQRPTVCGAVREVVMTSREQAALTPNCVAQGVQSVKLRQTTLLSECWGQLLPWMAGREDLTVCSHGPSTPVWGGRGSGSGISQVEILWPWVGPISSPRLEVLICGMRGGGWGQGYTS